ncbi:MAG: hypothetical protein JWN04_1164, partial [Myxococcaceae bacterium]|nr:hypothetical protein [Myxococcaceae bacterium]
RIEAVPCSHDPKKSRVHKPFASAHAREHDALWSWSCACGDLVGTDRIYETCDGCRTRVSRRTCQADSVEWPALVFPLPVLHPWRLPVAAALLGLLEDELVDVISSHESTELVSVLEARWGAADENLLQRMRRTSQDKEREKLARMLRHLEAVQRRRLTPDDLWLTDVRLLPSRLLFNGFPLGAATLTESPTSALYRDVEMTSTMLQAALQNGIGPLRQAGWIELQKRVRALFGDLIEPQSGTLADWWKRVWPTTAPSELELAVPGLFDRSTSDDLTARRSTRVFCGQGLFDTQSTALGAAARGIVKPDGIAFLPEQRVEKHRTLESTEYWTDRAAWQWLCRDALVRLSGVILSLSASDALWSSIASHLPVAFERTSLGGVILRELMEAMEPPRGRPSVVRDLLMGTPPMSLPSASSNAVDKVQALLERAAPGQSLGLIAARQVFATYLAGFWRVPASAAQPLGWIWNVDGADDLPTGARRVVPRLSDMAWELCPGFLAFTSPARVAAYGDWEPVTEEQWGWLGRTAPSLPGRSELERATPSIVPALLSEPPPREALAVEDSRLQLPTEAAPDATHTRPEIRVVEESVTRWLGEHLLKGTA